MHRLPPALLVVVLLASAGPAAGELVVLTGGDVVKVSSYRVEASKVRLELPSGGRLTLPLLRVERILADEIETVVPTPAAPWAVALRFRDEDVPPQTPYGDLIFETARRHGVSPRVVAAMARVESAFAADAVSVKGARGLMQLMPATAARFGVGSEELAIPARNLEAGVRYLRWLVDRFGEEEPSLVFAAYNAGEGAVARYGGIPPYRETRDYVRRLLALLGAPAAGEIVGGGKVAAK